MKRFLAALLLVGATLFTAAPASAADHHQHNRGNGYRSSGYRTYSYRPYGITTSYGYPYGSPYGIYGVYGYRYPVYGNPAASFANPAAFGYGPAGVQQMFGF